METQSESFKPWYVWPNPAFHFRLWYESTNCRIFIIENVTHNWDWLSKYRNRIRKTDFFFVQLGWHFHYYFVKHTQDCVDALGLDRAQFRIMYPDFAAMTYFTAAGFDGSLVNHNCFLDYDLFAPIEREKKYDAIYVARFAPFKRHFLAAEVGNLALVAGSSWGIESEYIPPHKYLNDHPLDAAGVMEKICESRVGLMLSEAEGACYSSSEYLLAGISVASTASYGGRDIWYNEMNSIICEPTASGVAKGVASLIDRNPSPSLIREMHIAQSEIMRRNFIQMHHQICCEMGEPSVDCRDYFERNYSHKLIVSEAPAFDELFPQS